MKNAHLKIWSFLAKKHGLTLSKKSIFGRNKNIPLKASNRISVTENDPETLFRPRKGPGTKKKKPRKDEVRVRVKQKILCQGVICT